MSFAAYLLYIAFSYLRPFEAFLPDMAESRPMLVLGALALALALLRALARREFVLGPRQYRPLALLVIAIAASELISGHGGDAAIAAESDFSASVLLFVLTALNVSSAQRLKVVCYLVLVCVVVLAAQAIFAYHTGFMAHEFVLRQNLDLDALDSVTIDADVVPANETSGAYFWRARGLGFLNDPNDFAQAIVMVVPFLLGLWIRRRGIFGALLVAAGGASLGYAMFLTHSRGALIALVVVFVFGVRRRLGTTSLVALGALALVAVLVGNFSGGRGFSANEESAGLRIDAWYEGLQLFKAHPLFGVGYGNFTDYSDLTAHNSFVLCFAELGLFGYFAWLGWIVLAFQELNKTIGSVSLASEADRAEQLRSALIGFLACAWFLSRTYQPGLYLLLALCLCAARLGSATRVAAGPAQPAEPNRWLRTTVVSMAASMGLVYLFVFVSIVLGR